MIMYTQYDYDYVYIYIYVYILHIYIQIRSTTTHFSNRYLALRGTKPATFHGGARWKTWGSDQKDRERTSDWSEFANEVKYGSPKASEFLRRNISF